MDLQPTLVAPTTHSKWPWILAGIALLVLGGVGGVFLGKYLASTNPTSVIAVPILTSDSTANWITYSNSQIGYEIKYPSSWGKAEPTNEIVVLSSGKEAVNLTCPWSADSVLPDPSQWAPNEGGFESLYIRKFRVNNMDAVENIWAAPDGSAQLNTYFIRSNKPVVCNLMAAISIPADKNFASAISKQTIYNQILSTFKFVDQIDTSDWKTYTNNSAGFSVQYPPTAKTGTRSADPFPVAIEISELTPRTGGGGGPELEGWLMIISETQENSVHTPLLQWAIDHHLFLNDPNYGSESSPIDTKVGTNNAITWYSSGAGSFTNYLIERSNGVTFIIINNSDIKNNEVIQQIMTSFKFTN